MMTPASKPPLLNDDGDAAARAAEWCLLVRSEDCTEADRAAFAAWLESDPEHARAYDKVLKVWSLSERLQPGAAQSRPPPAASAPATPLVRHHPATMPRHRPRMAPWQLAAAILLMVFLGYGGWLSGWIPDGYQRYSTEQSRRVATLPDGSRVEMNVNTRFSYAHYRDRREVTLHGDGEAFFDVAHDPTLPFEIAAGSGRIRVTGTAFNVWKYQEGVVVAVQEGSVRVSAQGGSVNLRPGMKAEYGVNNHPLINTVNIDDALAWLSGRLVLDNLPLERAVPQINRYLERPIILADESVAKLRIGGIYDTRNMAGLVEKLPNALPIIVRTQPDGTVILSKRFP